MAEMIMREDIEAVRSRANLVDIIGQYVVLKHAGSGNYVGLCPFHDEKTPSFHVTPSLGFYYCFGCGESGDVFKFLMNYENLSFMEALEQLANKTGVQLRATNDGQPSQPPGLRQEILAANAGAAEFYQNQTGSPEAQVFRDFVLGRGFDQQAAEHFKMGYAPKSGTALRDHLLGRFSKEVLIKSGLVRESGWDYFQGRVLWPISDSASRVLGFGARRVFDDDRMPAKYLNTPETPVYKKSQVLYGLDLARQAIGKQSGVVVVEGYTDVMACHLSGVENAVASCGTAFGAEHARILQRMIGFQSGGQGEVIFTFDGDEAGQKAALKAFSLDEIFRAQTYVAVDPDGRDPCDVRMADGPAAVRDLVGRRVPLYRFVMQNAVNKYDLDRADSRIQAVREAAPLLASVRDSQKVKEFLRELSMMSGVDIEQVRQIVAQASRYQNRRDDKTATHNLPDDDQPALIEHNMPDLKAPEFSVERACLQLMLTNPQIFSASWNELRETDFSHPVYQKLFAILLANPYFGEGWLLQIQQLCDQAGLQQFLIPLLVEPLVRKDPDAAYASAHSAKLQLISTERDLRELKFRLGRINPVTDPQGHQEAFKHVLELESWRRKLLADAAGLE